MTCTKCGDFCNCYNIAQNFKVTGTLNSTGKLRLIPLAKVTHRVVYLREVESPIEILTTEKTDEK